MSAESFFSVPREELLNHYPKIIQNSDEQYRAAITLNQNNQPGLAIPHLLMSTEEVIKAFIVVLDAKGFKFREVKGMDLFLKNHEIRFFLSSIIFAISLFGDDLINGLKILKADPSKAKEIANMLKDQSEMDRKLKWYAIRKFFIIRKELKWFAKAEVFRQNGNYVDMKGNLISPLNISQKEFDETRIRIDKVNCATKYMIESFLDQDPKLVKQLEVIKRNLSIGKYYQLIESGINDVRKNKESFFTKLNTEIFDEIANREKRKETAKFNKIIKKRTSPPHQ